MSLSIIVAMTDARVIGRDNALPWRIPEDLRRFKAITMGHPIIMGRRTYESIGKPLPGRRNVVVTSRRDLPGGVQTARTLCEALASCPEAEGERFVIGGARLFAEALPLADKLYLTLIHTEVPGDVYFPAVDIEKEFLVTERRSGVADGPQPLAVEYLTAVRRV